MFCHSPFSIHSAVLSGFRYSFGRAARFATRDAEATAPYSIQTASVGNTILHTHAHILTPHWIIPYGPWKPWMVLLADREEYRDVLWLAFHMVQVCVCMYVRVSLHLCDVFESANHVRML